MLDIKFIRQNPDLIKKAAKEKRIAVDIDLLLKIDENIRPKMQEMENLSAERNKISETIGKTKDNSERETLKAKVAGIKRQMEDIQNALTPLEQEFNALMLQVPQPARKDVPVGADDKGNMEIRKVGQVPKFDFKIKDHVALGTQLGIIDIPRGVKLAGSRSYILKGDGASLEQAVLRYTYDKLCAKGYVPLSIPVLVTEKAMYGTGYFPIGREQAYYIEKDALALVGTGEVSLTSYHAEEILSVKDLPLRFVTQSACFRREAGSYGKDTSGLYRVHQFQKIEQVIVAPADESLSEKLHDELLTNAEEILQDFGLPYRVVYVCTGDLGQGQVRKHDIETWMPSRNTYAETHSCSTFHDFQARRLKMRYKDEAAKTTAHCFTLNNTAIASPRILIPLLENFQTAEGKVRIPECLQKYMNGKKVIG